MYRITIDVGGTFTDCLVMDPTGALRQFKSYTTPKDPSQGFLDAVTKAAAGYASMTVRAMRRFAKRSCGRRQTELISPIAQVGHSRFARRDG